MPEHGISSIFITGYVQPARDCHNGGMAPSIEDQVVDFFGRLFGRIFSEPFEDVIEQRLKRNAVIRQVEESADAASQSVARFFLNEKLTLKQVTEILNGFAPLSELLKLEDIANPNVTPESVVDDLLPDLPCPDSVEAAGRGPVYRRVPLAARPPVLHASFRRVPLAARPPVPSAHTDRAVGYGPQFELTRATRATGLAARLGEIKMFTAVVV